MTHPMTPPMPGTILWTDLTVADADRVRDFYAEVVGWNPEAVEMGGYADWSMETQDGTAVAGVCHARGVNTDLPPVWLVYVAVRDLDDSLKHTEAGGGAVVVGPRHMGAHGRYAVIRDPAGAVLALIEPAR